MQNGSDFWGTPSTSVQWYIVCLNTLSGYRGTEGNIAVPFQLATTAQWSNRLYLNQIHFGHL